MKNINIDNFPIIQISFAGMNSDELYQFLYTCDQCLEKQQPFGFIIINLSDEMNAEYDPEIMQKNKQWLKRNKNRLSRYLKGVVTVVQSEQLQERFGEVFSRSTELLYGCPSTVVTSVSEAEIWLKEKLDIAD